MDELVPTFNLNELLSQFKRKVINKLIRNPNRTEFPIVFGTKGAIS